MITGNKKGSPARPPSDPQNAETKDTQSIAKKQSKSTNNLVNRLNGCLVEFSDSELLLEWINRQSFYLETLSNRRRVNG
mgnify:CR=1 FL=1